MARSDDTMFLSCVCVCVRCAAVFDRFSIICVSTNAKPFLSSSSLFVFFFWFSWYFAVCDSLFKSLFFLR